MKGFHTEEPFQEPRPVFATLPHAVATAVRFGNSPEDINLARWAETYGCSPEDVEAEFGRALTKIPPAIDCDGDGK
jgi:hypothetical protein